MAGTILGGNSRHEAPTGATSCLMQLLVLPFYLVGRQEPHGPHLAGALSPSASQLSSLLAYAAGHMSTSLLLYPEWGNFSEIQLIYHTIHLFKMYN